MRATALEIAVINRMLRDATLDANRPAIDSAMLAVTERNITEVGFITHLAETGSTKLFKDKTSFRWGQVVGRLNATIDVDFVVYVDNGYLTTIEGTTFGGENWPLEIVQFDLTNVELG